MGEFSLTTALEALVLDPFPTKEYRLTVRLLKDIRTIILSTEVKICCITDILEKLKTPLTDGDEPEDASARFVPTVEVLKLLSRMDTSSRVNELLVKLLRYLIMKLNRCTGEDAAYILRDFKELKSCIFVFRNSSIWNKDRLDGIVEMFVKKLVKMVKEGDPNEWKKRFHLYHVMRIMLTEFGHHPIYGVTTAKQLHDEIKIYNEKLEALQPGQEMDTYVYESYFTYLYILNEIVGRNLADRLRETNILADLRVVLDGLSQKQLGPREAYLVHNVLTVIEVYLNVQN